ncbi:GroES-like protein [Rhodotorula sp. JG-1b]|nr:GroES-like protein [Rhodotorula sp. JG-1b]
MKTVVVSSKGNTEVRDVPVPDPGAGEVVVKTSAIALNPTDWKHRDFLAPPGSWLGCDFAGTVEKVGSGVDNVRVGDRVAAFVHGGQWEGEGSFAEYVKAQAGLVWRVPDNLSDEEAAAAGGIGPWTAIQALYMRLGLNLPNSPSKDGEPILVWGGSTSVGLYALQLLKASGYTPISVSSPKNFDLVKKFGAAAVFDYNDPEAPAKVAKAYPSLQYGLDCISEGKTTVSIVKAIAAAKGVGRVVTLLVNKDSEIKEYADKVKVEMTLVYTVLGVEFDWPGMTFPAMPNDKTRMEEWCSKYLPELFQSGTIKPNPIQSFSGGLDNITEGLNYIKDGKNRGVKVTYKI